MFQMKMEMTIPGETVLQLVEFWSHTSDSNSPAFVSLDENGCKRSISRLEVCHFAKVFAHQLHALGVQKGAIVCNALPNSIERIVCEFGIYFAGATSINGQIFRADGEDFLNALLTSQSCMVIVDPTIAKGARQILLQEVPIGCENTVNSKKLPNLKKLINCIRDDDNIHHDFLSTLKNSHMSEYVANVVPSDIATIMTTSGSTGYSKLVRLSHQNICHFCKQVKAIEALKSGDHFLNCAPLGWAGGYPQWYLSCGVTRHFLDMHNGPPKDLPATVWRIIVEEKIVYGFVSPMYVDSILSRTHLWENSSWKPRTLCLAGQPIKKHLLDIIGKLCQSVDINYGLTEINLVSTHRVTDASKYNDCCAGYPGYGVQLKIVDQDRNVSLILQGLVYCF